MNNITRTTLAAAAMLTLLASSASATGYIKIGDIKGESEYHMMLQLEEARFLNESGFAGDEHEVEFDIAAFTDSRNSTAADHEDQIDVHDVTWHHRASSETRGSGDSPPAETLSLNYEKIKW